MTGVMHDALLSPEHLFVLLAGQICHTGTRYMDFVEIFNIFLDLSTIYLLYSCDSIPERWNLFSVVKLTLRSFFFIFLVDKKPSPNRVKVILLSVTMSARRLDRKRTNLANLTGVFHQIRVFLPITLEVIKVHSRNLVTFPKT